MDENSGFANYGVAEPGKRTQFPRGCFFPLALVQSTIFKVTGVHFFLLVQRSTVKEQGQK